MIRHCGSDLKHVSTVRFGGSGYGAIYRKGYVVKVRLRRLIWNKIAFYATGLFYMYCIQKSAQTTS